ncbi:hypothetical protein CES85_4999 [Ochrobactrum quorumnocens]|uniref:Uncharacterized protein n=1 Tax=Ochrobactrum quorumnocens TaxID=271865 RepID=A0A248UBN3_9HYPH|nr:hypothetical protein CES85_4999 [[Ochrobactrum] quorumnocens]
MRCVSKRITWKLISQDQKSQSTLGSSDPIIMRARGDLHMQIEKPFAENPIKSWVLLKPPSLLARLLPERENGPVRQACVHIP